MTIRLWFKLTKHLCNVALLVAALSCIAQASVVAAEQSEVGRFVQLYQSHVRKSLTIPLADQIYYAELIQAAVIRNGDMNPSPQFVLAIDKSKYVQAALLYLMTGEGSLKFIGASAVSTGRPGSYEHFETPTGVFEHSIFNPDFRAEGTSNEQGTRGYGAKGMRIYDFGWQMAKRGWGAGGQSLVRLQMHATDPDKLAWKLGSAQSKGCIRISADLNLFLDQYSILDADYEQAIEQGHHFWVLRADRQRTPWSGRYLVILDTLRTKRPEWSPDPMKK